MKSQKTLVTGISLVQAADAFGDHWINVYSPKLYGSYFKGASNRGLINILMGFVRGVGRYYKEDLKTMKPANGKLHVIFPK